MEDTGKMENEFLNTKEDALSFVSSIKTISDESAQIRCYEDPTLFKAVSMPYRDFRVSIYKKSAEAVDQFYYEPIVSLDPKSIVINRAYDSQFQVTFTIEMWNNHLESLITKYLRDKRGVEQLDESNVQVMPYEEIRLVEMDYDSKKNIFTLPNRPKSYLLLNQSLNFDVFCDNKEAAEIVANPSYLATHLALVFKSPASGLASSSSDENLAFHHGAMFGMKRTNRFEFNIVRKEIADTEVEQKLELKMEALIKGLIFHLLLASFLTLQFI